MPFKHLNSTGPTYIGSLFKYRHTPNRLRGEGLNLELPNFNRKFRFKLGNYTVIINVILSIKTFLEVGNNKYIIMCNFGGRNMSDFEVIGDPSKPCLNNSP